MCNAIWLEYMKYVYCIVISLSSLNSLCDALRELDEDLDTDVSLRDSDEDGFLGSEHAELLRDTLVWVLGVNLALRAGQEHKLETTNFTVVFTV